MQRQVNPFTDVRARTRIMGRSRHQPCSHYPSFLITLIHSQREQKLQRRDESIFPLLAFVSPGLTNKTGTSKNTLYEITPLQNACQTNAERGTEQVTKLISTM